MKARHRAALVAALTALGCAGQPGPNQLLYRELEGQFATAATVSLRVNLSLPERELQALAKKWQVADVNLLRVKLLRDDGAGFVDTGLTQDLSRKVAPIATGASFNQLAAGKRYRVDVGAWGEVGGSAATALLNAQNPATADFDFSLTPGQDLGASKSATVAIRLDDVAFSGTAKVTPSGVPAGASTLEAQLWVQGAQDPVATQSLVSTASTIAFGGLRAGPDYETRLKARDANQAVLAEIASTSFRFDPNAAQLEQVVAFGLSLPGASAAPSVAPSVAPSAAPPAVVGNFAAGLSPTDVAIDSLGNAWVVNADGGSVLKLSSMGSVLGTFTLSLFGGLYGLAIDPQGSVWVSNLDEAKVIKLSSAGAILGTHNVGSAPRGVAVSSTGQVWVANNFGNSVTRLASNGGVQGTHAVGNEPIGVALDAQGRAWVTATNNRVNRLESNGTGLAAFSVGSGAKDLAIGAQGEVWVANESSNNVTRLSSSGSVLGTYAVGGGPCSIATDSAGKVWVANGASNSVTKLASNGSVLATIALSVSPFALTVDAQGGLWVTSSASDRVLLIR